MLKKLPIGKQDFAQLINENYIYADKTECIHKLITTGSVYFLSRPRRFGKSLLVSTLKEIFSGNKELFKNLWIYDKIDWKQYPVIHISFASIGYKTLGLVNAINKVLSQIGQKNNITLQEEDCGLRFAELIKKMAHTNPVAILIDEYDKPIIDCIEDIPAAENNREILKNFYSVVKDNDNAIKFLFITGVSKFSKVSIFSDLNHLSDITIHDKYSTICGYTDHDLQYYFKDYLEQAKHKFPKINVVQEIRKWYNGYSWDGQNFVYNPFSILSFFDKYRFSNFWFQTGTPTFLTKLIQQRNFNVINLEGISIKENVFEKYTIENIEILSLLFQTGYLTIKNYDYKTLNYLLSYPNNEVRLSFDTMLFNELSCKLSDESASLLNDIKSALQNNAVEKFINLLKISYKNITYPLIDDKEKYFHSIFYLLIKLLGFEVETEVLTSDGRIDAVVKTEKYIFIIEFKMGKAQNALKQIKEKEYALKYAHDARTIILLGIGFSKRKKNIGDFEFEPCKPK